MTSFPAPDTGLASFPASDHGRVAFPSPDAAVVAFPPQPIAHREAIVVMDATASATWVVVPKRGAVVTMAGAASAVVSGTTSVAAVVTMDAVAEAYRNVDGPVVMDGSAGAAVQLAAIITAPATMDAVAGIVGQPIAIVTADVMTSMDATAGIAIEGYVTAVATMNGSAGATVSGLADRTAVVTMDGAASATWEVIHTVAMGMSKDATTKVLDQNVWTKITGWVVRTTAPGYPDTVISGDGLALRAGVYSTIAAQVRFTNSTETTLRFKRGSTVILTGTETGEVDNVTLTATNVTWPTNGEILTIEALRNDTTSYRTVAAGSNTYVTATPA